MNENTKNSKEPSLAEMPTKKKISFFAAIMLVIGNSIGAGIFFKSKTVMADSGASLPIAIISWVVAGIAVICMALALVEVSSGRNDNLAMIGWCKAFNGKYIYKGCKYFMAFIYLPLTYFFMPLYVLLSIQDAAAFFGATTAIGDKGNTVVNLGRNYFGTSDDWILWSLIGLALTFWFVIASGLSSRIGNIQNKIITMLKFVPLVFAALMGWIMGAMDGFDIKAAPQQHWNDSHGHDFFAISPLFGFFGALASIFFAYDGFYATAGIQSEMREPRKTPKAIVIGLSIVTLVYLLIAISMSVVSSEANLYSFADFLVKHNCGWIGGVANLLIAFGVMGIMNGYSMWCSRYLQDLIKEGELPIPVKWFKKCNDANFPVVGVIATLIFSVPAAVIFDIIGGLAYFPGEYEGGYDAEGFNSTAKLYSLADLMATWCAVFAFAFIACAILGCIKNRKTNRVEVTRSKYFIPTAWIAVIIVFVSMAMTVVQPFVDIGLYAGVKGKTDVVISNALLVIILIVFGLISFGPVYLEEKLVKLRLFKLQLMLESIQKGRSVDAKESMHQASDDYIESLRGYIKATQIGVESFKINVKATSK